MKIGNFYIGNKTQNKLLLFLCLLLALWLIFLMMNRTTPKEGFEQSDRFVLRRNQDMYDDFLARIYDKIYQRYL
jgi:TM2 domain-containing membrane protein YozV